MPESFDDLPPITDPDLIHVEAALIRAARAARELAARTGTPLVLMEDGVVVGKMIDPVTLEAGPSFLLR